MIVMTNHRQDGDHQRHGIDRSIILSNSKQILIDEKVRGKNKKTGKIYTDIALEYLSDEERNKPGWIQKPLLCDYIAYCIAPLGRCYLLPTLQLQFAWEENKHKWLNNFEMRAENKNGDYFWTTISYPVPVAELFKAIGSCLRIDFEKYDFNE